MAILKPVDKALLNPSRFHIYFYLLRNGPRSVSDLARELEMVDAETKKKKKLSKTAVSKHCSILEKAGLLIPKVEFKGKQGIRKIYRATSRPRWEEFIVMKGLDPKKLPDDVYEKMDELAFHPRYLKIVKEVLKDEIEDVSLMRQKEKFDSLLFERKNEILTKVKEDPELYEIYKRGFGSFFKFLLKIQNAKRP